MPRLRHPESLIVPLVSILIASESFGQTESEEPPDPGGVELAEEVQPDPPAAPAPAPPADGEPMVEVESTGETVSLDTYRAIIAEAEKNTPTQDVGRQSPLTPAQGGTSSAFTIGTLVGLAIPLYEPVKVIASNGNLELQREVRAEDYFRPAAFVLPSIALASLFRKNVRTQKQTAEAAQRLLIACPLGLDDDTSSQCEAEKANPRNYDFSIRSQTLAAIVPLGVSTSAEGEPVASLGLGLSWGFTVSRGAEIGFAAAVVWSPDTDLSPDQVDAIRQGGVVAEEVPTGMRPALTLGFYIAPTL